MKKWIIALSIVSTTASMGFAKEYSKVCKANLEQQAINAEILKLQNLNQIIAGELQASSYVNQKTVVINIVDSVDGRSIAYKGSSAKTDHDNCKINLDRAERTSCRYSAVDGEDNMDRIPGFSLNQEKTISGDEANEHESVQIAAMLKKAGYEGTSLKELISQTDDQQVVKFSVVTPEGRKLTFFKYYAGDTAVGSFFKGNSKTFAGTDNDGEICIKP